MLRCSERAGPSDPRLPRLQEGGETTCLVRPLILFNPRSPLVRVFFLSCWRKALRPVEKHGKVLHNPALILQCDTSDMRKMKNRVDRWHLILCSCTLSEGGVRGSATFLEAGSRQAALGLGQEVGGKGQWSSSGQQSSTFSPQGQKRWHLTHSRLQGGGWTGWGLQTAVRRGTIWRTHHNTYTNRTQNKLDSVYMTECGLTCATYVWHTNMEGCTGGNGPKPQPECVCGRWWWEGAGGQGFALPPPPPGPSVAPLRWCWFPAGCWAKWSGSRAIC